MSPARVSAERKTASWVVVRGKMAGVRCVMGPLDCSKCVIALCSLERKGVRIVAESSRLILPLFVVVGDDDDDDDDDDDGD